MTVAGAAGGVGVGVFAVGVGVLLLPYPLLFVELPQAATSNASKRTMLIGRARLRCFMSYRFLLDRLVKLGFCRAVSSPSVAGIVTGTCREPVCRSRLATGTEAFHWRKWMSHVGL